MTWNQFIARTKGNMPLNADRLGMQTLLSNAIKSAVIDIQSHIYYYRKNHETLMVYGDFAEDGSASTGSLPDKALLNEAYLVFNVDSSGGPDSDVDAGEDSCDKIRLAPYPWHLRFDLVCDCVTEGKIAISESGEIYVYPALESGDGLLIYYDQLKSDFLGADTVPFDHSCAEAAALYASSRIAREVEKDIALANSYMQDYIRLRSRMYVDAKDMGRIRRVV